ncbi:MAG: carbonic anhydrase [Flavobacteriales bacterium]|nr:carbonic anhydrase [Flavobacteriales bacterium]
MTTQTKDSQTALTPDRALNILVEGNKRFVTSAMTSRDLSTQIKETSTGQFPFAVVLSCIDSRVPSEIVFDQGIGDVFSARVAGNIVNVDILGSIEYGCKVAGSKVIVVLGHTKCGAVTSACKEVELGNITALLSKIKPAISTIKQSLSSDDAGFVEKVAEQNVLESIQNIRKESPILAEMESNGEIKIVGAIYSVETGEVSFI